MLRSGGRWFHASETSGHLVMRAVPLPVHFSIPSLEWEADCVPVPAGMLARLRDGGPNKGSQC